MSPDTVILIPTYNNAGTLADVVQRALAQGLPVMVVNDGSTDNTSSVLTNLQETVRAEKSPISCPNDAINTVRAEKSPISCPNDAINTVRAEKTPNSCPKLMVVHHERNQGKGRALKTGFQEARKQGFRYAITIDSDGQHHPEDIPVLLAAKGEKTLVVGSRSVRGNDGGSSFANRFSNFWFTLYTGVKLPDTQTGYRLYPLEKLPWLGILSARYEAELTLLVFSAWKGLRLEPVPVQVEYPEDRVTHFHPVKDFTRISVLNTLLLFVAILYGYPRTLLNKIGQSFRKNS